MKDEDVKIGMKVQKKYDKDNVYVVKARSEYLPRIFNAPVYTIKNIKSGMRVCLFASEFEPYIDIELTAEQLSKAIDNLKDTLFQQLKPIVDFVAKNKDTFEKFVEKSKEEKLEKEIREAFDEYTNKECSYSLQTCFRAGFLAGRESK